MDVDILEFSLHLSNAYISLLCHVILILGGNDNKFNILFQLENTNLNVTSQNLLEYFVTLVYTTYPKLLFWYKDVSIKINSKGM